ncbi:MAG: hypothetical protein J5522_05435 [Lachnospiraceae bacterium]|nr:hypothetical protein [Lachnospiraceae bacterium]
MHNAINTFLYVRVTSGWSDDDSFTLTGGFLKGNMFYIVLGLICLATAAWLLYKKFYRYTLIKKACTVPVDARLFCVDSKFGGRGGRFWNITYEFYYNEQRYLVNNDIWEQKMRHRPIEGNVETILLNPYDPHMYYDSLMDTARKNGIFMGILIAGMGIFIMLMPLFVK